MSDHNIHRYTTCKRGRLGPQWASRTQAGGQALIEYVLILTLVAIALIAVLTITGPVVGNVFSNVVYNLVGGTVEPRDTLSAEQFWNQVAAVASYTPETTLLPSTNTPAPASATPTIGPSATSTPITPSPTPSNTATPGPSATPIDQNFPYPYNDNGDKDSNWEHDFDGVLDGVTWNAEYWDYNSFLNDMSSMTPGSGKYRTTYTDLNFYWASGTGPGGGVKENFYARYTATVNLENKPYTWNIKKDDGIRIWVGGQLVVAKDKPLAGDAETWAWNPLRNNWFTRTFTPTAGANDIVIEFYDGSSTGELRVALSEGGNFDTGDCNWAISTEQFYSSPSAWSDSPGANYTKGTRCILALRGMIDLRGSTNPTLEFWDRYSLSSNTKAMVGVSIAGTGNWIDVPVHYNLDLVNLAWSRQVFDLTNFRAVSDTNPGYDFSKNIIEFRFVLDATAASSGADGWWIDDIKVQNQIIKRYTVGFADDMEGEPHFYAGGSWARSNEFAHSGSTAWSDSPGTNYADGSNSILELDGLIDLTGATVVEPELVFWDRYQLTTQDAIFAEVSLDNRKTWTPLTGSYLARNSFNLSWNQRVLSLASYKGTEFYFRFRLNAPKDGTTSDGWWIDDFALRNSPTTVVVPDWCDNMEVGGGDWVPEGTWALVNGSDVNPQQNNQTVSPYSGSQFWSDSPRANYLTATESALMLKSKLDLTGTTSPQMVFWHQWDLGNNDDIFVEVSTDDGTSWTPIWSFYQGQLPPGYGNVPFSPSSLSYDHNLSWTREVINLSSYVGQIIRVRFRLDALLNAGVDDGWWIDDVCFQEYSEPVRRIGFTDGFEQGRGNWYAGGTWNIAPDNGHSGGSITDSYGVLYKHETNAILELRGIVDLAGTVKPTLYFWDTFNLETEDYALVEIRESSDGGATWGLWNRAYQQKTATTTSWDRRQVDLSPYVGKVIRIRFRLYAVKDPKVAQGWSVDDVALVDRKVNELTFPLPFNEDVEAFNNFWVMDGTWNRVTVFRLVGSGSGLGPGTWTGEYFSDTNKNHQFDSGELKATRSDAQINFNWGTGSPIGGVTSDYFMVRWTRTINVARDNTNYQIQTWSDDGIRVKVDVAGDGLANDPWQIDRWIDRGVPPTPDLADVVLDAGPHTIVVEYYESSSSASARVDFGLNSRVFHDSPGDSNGIPGDGNGDVNYYDKNDMSVTLDHLIDLTDPSLVNPALSYWQIYAIGGSDVIYTEVSTDGGFTWTVVRQIGAGTDLSWGKEQIDLSAFKGNKIKIRFRLDARGTNTATGDGWWIDDIQVAD